MTRTIPTVLQRSLEQSSSGDPILIFVEVTHPSLVQTIRLVRDGVDYVMDGETWARSWFEIDWLTDEESPPQAKFRFPNVDRAAITMLEKVDTPVRVALHVVSASYFDLGTDPRVARNGVTVEKAMTASGLFFTEVTADQVQVEGTLRSYDYRQEPWPVTRAIQSLTPALYMR
jgi:hypothetical protein